MLHTRSNEKELLDLGRDHYTQAEYIQCQNKLFKINKHLGIYRSIAKLLQKSPKKKSILDIGCGGGLFILQLGKSFPQHEFHGVDISTDAINLAKENLAMVKNPVANVSFSISQQNNFNFTANSVDIIFSTLVCHHLTDDELCKFFEGTYQACRENVVIHDLHRHPVAYGFFWLLSKFFYRNRLISHDGLISIKRSFRYSDWASILNKTTIKNYTITWQFPFRWQVILWKN